MTYRQKIPSNLDSLDFEQLSWDVIWKYYLWGLQNLENAHRMVFHCPQLWEKYSILLGSFVGYFRELINDHYRKPSLLYINTPGDYQLITSQSWPKNKPFLPSNFAYIVTSRRQVYHIQEIPDGRQSKLLRSHFEDWDTQCSPHTFKILEELTAGLLVYEVKLQSFFKFQDELKCLLKEDIQFKIHPPQTPFGVEEILHLILTYLKTGEIVNTYPNCNPKVKYVLNAILKQKFLDLRNVK